VTVDTLEAMSQPVDVEVVVLGAGVIGLTTAITLAERGRRVHVRTAEPPEATTSAAAAALWGPWMAGPAERVHDWAKHTLDVLTNLAGEPDSGVRMATGRDISTSDHQPPDWFALLPHARPCTPDELPAGYTHGTYYTAPLVDMPTHLRYLTRRLDAANATLEINPIATMREATAGSRRPRRETPDAIRTAPSAIRRQSFPRLPHSASHRIRLHSRNRASPPADSARVSVKTSDIRLTRQRQAANAGTSTSPNP